MKCIYIGFLSIFGTVLLHPMDNDNDKEDITLSGKPAPLERIDTVEGLRQSLLKSRTQGSEVNPRRHTKTIAPNVTAQVAHAITYNKDPNDTSRIQKKLTAALAEMEIVNPPQYSNIVNGIFVLTEKYNDVPVAAGVKGHKDGKHSNPNTPTTSSDSPKGTQIVRTVLEKQATITQEMAEQEKKLSEIKEQMRILTWQAAEDAHREERDIAQRNMYLGLVGTVGAAIVTAIATYYGAINAARIASGGANAPAPACNGTL